jgi:NAD-dependent dihydropyrimidine dehydrogenase PreA subunit
LGSEHAGLLTSSSFLLRFQTNRARANRFYDAFLCEPFQPPSGGIPESTDEEALVVDLQQRAGCRYCHAQLEPAAARWGRWVQLGGGYLDPAMYPAQRDDCYQCALGLASCSTDCILNYVTRQLSVEQTPYFGMLRSYEFRREEHQSFVEDGPARLVHEATADGRFPACTTRRTAEWLLGRELRQEEQPWLDEVTFEYVQGGMRYRDLVRSVVLSQVYRRVR